MPELSPRTKTWLRMAVDYSGAAAFVIGYLVTHDFQQATWWLVGFSALAIAVNFIMERKLAPLPLIYGGASLIFGTLTLVFHDKTFIKMKPTFMDITLGAAMLIGLAIGKSPIKLIMSDTLKLSDAGWKALTLRFGLFFLVLAVLNEAVWRTQPDASLGPVPVSGRADYQPRLLLHPSADDDARGQGAGSGGQRGGHSAVTPSVGEGCREIDANPR